MTEESPKCLMTLGHTTLLERQVAALRAGGCSSIGIVTGYRAELVRGAGDAVFHNPNWQSSNMVTSLGFAEAWLSDEALIVSYSDIFYSGQTVEALIAAPGDLAISYDPAWLDLWSLRFEDPLSDAETFRRDSEGWLIEIGARTTEVARIDGQYMGLLKVTPRGWEAVRRVLGHLDPERRRRIDMTGLLALLIADGVRIGTVPVVGLWGECDNPSDLAIYQGWVAEGRLAD